MPGASMLFPGGPSRGNRRRSKFHENSGAPGGQGQQGKQGATSIMFWLYYLVSGLKFIKHKKDLNWVDRLAYHWTTVVLLGCAITVTAKQYVGVPIQCWVPAQFTKAMEQYAENYCWASNTYFVQMNRSIPEDLRERKARELTYYQWVPFILVLQAGVVCIPCVLWRAMYWQTGFDIAAMVEAAAEIRVQAGDDRKRLLFLLCSYMYETCRRQIDLGHTRRKVQNRVLPSAYRGYFVTYLCCTAKFLCLMNCALQLSLLNIFLCMEHPYYGIKVLIDLANGISWRSTGLFPRVTLCDFQVRELANVHRHTIQCVLVINMFNEKIYIFLWFWFLLLMLLVGYNLAMMIFQCSEKSRLTFLERYFIPKDSPIVYEKVHRYQLREFLNEVLQYDGILILKNIAAHAGEFVCSEVITSLYEWHEDPGGPTAAPPGNVSDVTGSPAPRRQRSVSDQHEKSPLEGVDSMPTPVIIQPRRKAMERPTALATGGLPFSKPFSRMSHRRHESGESNSMRLTMRRRDS